MKIKTGFLFLLVLLFSSTCNKNNTFTGPKIASTTDFVRGYTAYYYYNTDGTIDYWTTTAGTKNTYSYSGSNLLQNNYTNTGVNNSAVSYTLNSSGYATSAQGEILSENYSANYSYSSTGQITQSQVYNSKVLDTTYNFTIGNKNIIELNTVVNSSNTNTYDYYTFFTSNSNTIGPEDYGFYYTGVQNSDLLQYDIQINQVGDTTDIITYRYYYDTNGNVDTFACYHRNGRMIDSAAFTYD